MRLMSVLLIPALLASISFGSLFTKAKEAGKKCWDNPTCKESVIKGVSGVAASMQKKK